MVELDVGAKEEASAGWIDWPVRIPGVDDEAL